MTPRDTSHAVLAAEDLVWAIGRLCSLSRLPFSAELLLKQFPPRYSHDALVRAARSRPRSRACSGKPRRTNKTTGKHTADRAGARRQHRPFQAGQSKTPDVTG